MIDFIGTDAGRVVDAVLRISSPTQISQNVLNWIDANSSLSPSAKQSIQLIVERALFNPASGEWSNVILRLPLYAPYVGIGAGDQTPLTDQEREGLWLVVVQICKSMLEDHIAQLQAIVDAVPVTPPENWKEQ